MIYLDYIIHAAKYLKLLGEKKTVSDMIVNVLEPLTYPGQLFASQQDISIKSEWSEIEVQLVTEFVPCAS